jgi:hypothetical protein
MFVYSFLVMTAYNNIKPSAASKFIDDLGADNVPYVMLLAGLTMGFIMNYYSRAWEGAEALGAAGNPGGDHRSPRPSGSCSRPQVWVSAAFFFFGRLLLGIFSSASSGRWRTGSTTPGRRNASSASSGEARCSAG